MNQAMLSRRWRQGERLQNNVHDTIGGDWRGDAALTHTNLETMNHAAESEFVRPTISWDEHARESSRR